MTLKISRSQVSTQPNPPKILKKLWPNPTHGWTQPMTNSDATCRFQDRRPGFQCLTGQALGYLAEVCQLVADVSARRLRSADTATCVMRCTSNIFGNRCFAAAGLRLWNSLSTNLRQCHSLEQFTCLLKTFLFSACGHGTLSHLPKSVSYINPLT